MGNDGRKEGMQDLEKKRENEELEEEREPEIDTRRCAVCGGLNPGDITHTRC